jgi:magnesium transporter
LDFLTQRFNIPNDFLTASLDIDEISRTESEGQTTLIILKTPFFDETNLDVLYFTVPIGIILTNGLIITICPKGSEVILDFIRNKVRNFSTLKRNRFVLQLYLRATLLFLQYLKQINNAAAIIQKKLEQSSKNKQLIKLLNIEKSLVYFTTSLKSNFLMLERFQKLDMLEINYENEDLFEDIIIESKQAIEMANIYSDILSGMMDAFASIISNNLNIVMKVLTSIAIIMTLPILISSLYGMNVKLPLQESPYAFFFVIIISVVLALMGVAFFAKRGWLEL